MNKLTLNDFNLWNKLSTALGRFNKSYTRQSLEDRIVDLSICLEACLLAGVQQELKYRLTIRAAAVCSKHQDPEYTRQVLETLYDLRSDIVHQGCHMPDRILQKKLRRIGMKQEDFIEAAENTSRLVLQQFVSIMSKTNYDVQQTCEKIDASIYKCLK